MYLLRTSMTLITICFVKLILNCVECNANSVMSQLQSQTQQLFIRSAKPSLVSQDQLQKQTINIANRLQRRNGDSQDDTIEDLKYTNQQLFKRLSGSHVSDEATDTTTDTTTDIITDTTTDTTTDITTDITTDTTTDITTDTTTDITTDTTTDITTEESDNLIEVNDSKNEESDKTTVRSKSKSGLLGEKIPFLGLNIPRLNLFGF
ncbi:papilin-like [Oppia nitens]|uniref:papilin-like n=1 Tax=Oppia nitens TaxID=1686743 RepID=UPI0023DBC554|nr:papilin-like [Oppia nitens]